MNAAGRGNGNEAGLRSHRGMLAGLLGLLRPLNPVLRTARNTYIQFDKDRIPAVAASTTFFVLLAIFPAFASIVSLYGLFADRTTIAQQLHQIQPFLPHGAIVVLDNDLQRLIERPPQQIGLTFIIGLAIALWSASGGFRALVEGLNIAYDASERRGFLKLSLVGVLMTACAIVFCVLALNLAVAIPVFLDHVPLGTDFKRLFPILSWPVTFLMSLLGLSGIYTYVPCRGHHSWRWISWGSFVASSLWLLGTLIFKWYVQNFGSFDRVYGNLGAVVGFLTWIWLSLVIVLLGAELNRELERRALR